MVWGDHILLLAVEVAAPWTKATVCQLVSATGTAFADVQYSCRLRGDGQQLPVVTALCSAASLSSLALTGIYFCPIINSSFL